MKYDWKRWLSRTMRGVGQCSKLAAASIVAGGLIFAGSAHAIEAIENGSFEDPSPAGWVGGFGVYDHSSQVYYEGPAPANSGSLYGWDPGITAPQIATQTLNLAQGIGQIDAGTANYDFSAWLSSWTNDSNYAILEVEWNDSVSGNGVALGSVVFDGNDGFSPFIVGSADADGNPDPNVPWTQDNWSLYQSQGTIPAGARSAVVTYRGEGNDAYADLVSLDIPFEVGGASTLGLSIDRDLRTVTVENNTGIDQVIRGYSIFSTDGALIEEVATFLADSDSEWVQFTAPGARSDLSEGHLTSYVFPNGASIELGAAWLPYFLDETDIQFEYLDEQGRRVNATDAVTFSGNNGESFVFLDFDRDGDVDRSDWETYAMGLGADLSDLSVAESYYQGDLNGDLSNDHADFLIFKDGFDAVNGDGAFDAMLVPEPLSLSGFIVGLGGMALLARRRRRG